jgi:hypothetical protein
MRRAPWLAATLALLIGPAAWADEEYDKLQADFQKAQQAWFKEVNKASEAQTDKSKPLDISNLSPRPEPEFKPRFKAYAEKNAGKPAAIPALVWLMQAGALGGTPDADGKAALEALTKAHAGQEEIGEHLEQLRYFAWQYGRKPLIELFERVAKENGNRKAVAWAEFNTAIALCEPAAEDKPGDDRSADKKRAGELFRKVVSVHKGTDAARSAEGYIFELDNLQIGMKAPDFEGEDVDGKKIKLSDFRGKVVVIDFWGYW